VTSELAQVTYKCTDIYDPGGEIAVQWNDPELEDHWPLEEIYRRSCRRKISRQNRCAVDGRLPWFEGGTE